MNIYGIVMGAAMLPIVRLGHILVVKTVKQWGAKAWIGFFLGGVAALFISFVLKNIYLSGLFGLFGGMCLWGIYEVIKYSKKKDSFRKE